MSRHTIEWMDLGNTGKELEWEYHGKERMHLEGRIMGQYGDQLKIALLGPDKGDIAGVLYRPARAMVEIYVTRHDGIRAGLRKADLYVPLETRIIRVLDEAVYKLPDQRKKATRDV
ncbi:hypothetical protein HY639_03130 [Candidatus Woesearchaeota archaeon]|nr:hypothetical protein [Candidatus Woesearchaeota archaeon]